MFAEKLTELRGSRSLTQSELGAALDVSGKTVSKWENGTSEPDIQMLLKLAEFFGVTQTHFSAPGSRSITRTRPRSCARFTKDSTAKKRCT